ncbi:hypothetical protein SO802_018771 [Lithocarpus litseifolius]|uniref:Uncharacterized protein n=1 Tax=Lithocarpus litseifolius TaxID=425828 RepID=A0AAW2CNX5_9ROSI
MASRSMFISCVLLLLVLCLLVLMEETASTDCNTGYVCFYSKASVSLMTTHNRKMLAGLEEKKKTVKLGLQVSAATRVFFNSLHSMAREFSQNMDANEDLSPRFMDVNDVVDANEDLSPRIGMEFDTLEDA